MVALRSAVLSGKVNFAQGDSRPFMRMQSTVGTAKANQSRLSANANAAQSRDAVIAITLLAFVVRVISAAVIRPWPVAHDPEFWKLGFEIVNIASSISLHQGFSSPFGISSGPTAWIAPIYPYLLAAIFKVAGFRTDLAAATILLIQSLFSALTCIPIYIIGKKAFDEWTGRYAAWGWAFFPYAVLIPVLSIWETTLSGFLLALLCCLSLDLPQTNVRQQIGLGALWGIAGLTNPALLALAPFFVLRPYFRTGSVRGWARTAALSGAVCLLILAPWIYRDWLVLGKLIPVRSNFGEEIWQGNHEGGRGRIAYGTGPADNQQVREHYRELGEIAYVAERQQQSTRFIARHPRQYVEWVLYRVRYWWFAEGEPAPVFWLYRVTTLGAVAGLVFASRRRAPRADLPIIALLVYPIVYYITDIYPRYRYPIEPFMVILGAFAASQIWREVKTRFRTSP
jgi:4-amino-4-deoxy-L-arabinose transferase-like glycosyltransferase